MPCSWWTLIQVTQPSSDRAQWLSVLRKAAIAVPCRDCRGDAAAPEGGSTTVPSILTTLIQFLHFPVDQGHAKSMKKVTSWCDNCSPILVSDWLSTAGTKDSKKVLDFSIRQAKTMAILQLVCNVMSCTWILHKLELQKRYHTEAVKPDEQAEIWRTAANKRNVNIAKSKTAVFTWGCVYFYLTEQFLPNSSICFKKCKIKM